MSITTKLNAWFLFLPWKPVHREEDTVVPALQGLGHAPESEGWEFFVCPPHPGTPLVHAEDFTCSVPHLCSGSLCCGEHFRAFVMVFNQYLLLFTHTHPFLHQSISLAVTASGRNQKNLRGSMVNVSIFVVISCSVNT